MIIMNILFWFCLVLMSLGHFEKLVQDDCSSILNNFLFITAFLNFFIHFFVPRFQPEEIHLFYLNVL